MKLITIILALLMNFISVSYASGWKVDPISARQNYNYKVGLMAKGEGVYNTNCAGCHQKDGTGMPPIFPAIKNSAIVNGDSVANISIVLHGKGGMPTFKMFDDENLAAVITYTRNAFGNTGSTVKPSDIKSARLNYNYHSLAESNTPTTVYITNMVDIPMRSSNKIEREPSNLLKMLPSGTQLTVLSTENGWTKVKFKNTVGWIISRYLKHVGQKTYITDMVDIPMRSNNKIQSNPSNLLKMIPSYTRLELLLTESGWSKVRLDNQEGWIISRYLTSKKPELIIPSIDSAWVYNDNRMYSMSDNIVADIKSPEIYLNQSIFLTVNESQVQLSGIIKDSSKISELTIFGSSVPINKSGKFNTTLYVPLGKSNITIEAIDVFGNKSGKVVTVVRNKAVVKNTAKRLIPPTVMMNSNPNAVALIIGVDKYESITSAPWAESDAGSFYDYAQNVLGISADRIRLITGSDSSEAGIWKSVERWLPTVVDRNKSDVYLYFAGHGLASADGNNAYLIPWDGDPDLLERTSILRSELIDGLKDLNAANVTLFMDTCYSGKARGGKGTLVADSRGLRIVKKDTLYNLPNNFTLFAAAANDETASSHTSLKHGLFSYWMMRGLGGDADSNGDRKITNGELHAFINKNVQKSAVSMGRKQHSQLVGDKDKVIASW
jgi:mono/diheme cytochrome c family protein/uncharacterized protein YraI